MKLYSPIQKTYLWGAHTCMVNQLFGENKNRLFYGPEGHSGWDVKTRADWKYKRNNKVKGGWEKVERTPEELDGRIPIVACHSGVANTILYDDKQGMGWGVTVTSDVLREKDRIVQYKTVYWHIETPWRSLRLFKFKDLLNIETLKQLFTGREVRKGAIIAIGGNNGKSTGPHLHLTLKRRVQIGDKWTAWEAVDPRPHFADKEVVYHRYYGPGYSDWFYEGEKITATKAKQVIKSLKE